MPRYLLCGGVLTAAVVAAVLTAFPAGSEDRTTVYAAASLREVLPALDAAPRYSFAGSSTLRRQIETGAPADVFVAASPRDPGRLRATRRCSEPVTFATNRLVLLVPATGSRTVVRTLDDLRRGGLRIALATPGVPAGGYARDALGRLGLLDALERSKVSDEPDVKSVVAKVALGSADAGFAYATDARAARGRVEPIAVPASAQPLIRYQACAVLRPGGVVSARARHFVGSLTSDRARATLRRFGFGLPRHERVLPGRRGARAGQSCSRSSRLPARRAVHRGAARRRARRCSGAPRSATHLR